MHILHLIKTSNGAPWAINMIRALEEKFPDVSQSVLIPPGGKYYKTYIRVCKNVYEFDFKINHNIVKYGLNLRKIIKYEKPDIIHSWFTQTTLYARLFLRDINVPRLFEVVGPLHLETFLYRLGDIYSAQKNDFWKATSIYTKKKYLQSGVSCDKIFMNYVIPDLDRLLCLKNDSQELNLRKRYNLPNNSTIIGAASWMYPPKLFERDGVKNHEQLLKVFDLLLKKRKDVVCVIGGKSVKQSYEHYLQEKAKRISSNRIIFTGYVENFGRLIEEFDVFIHLSLSENLGGVYESLLHKVPTVASDRGGIPELVIDGETGFTCNLKSTNEIVDKIEFLLENQQLREKFKENGFAKVMQIFDKEKSIVKSYSIYKEILENRNSC